MWALMLAVAVIAEADAGWEDFGGFRPGTSEKYAQKVIAGNWTVCWFGGNSSGGSYGGGSYGYVDNLGGEWWFDVDFLAKRGAESRVEKCTLRYRPFAGQPPWLKRAIKAISPPEVEP